MPFRSFDNLRVFEVIARHMSFTVAAEELHLTKGALSYQIKKLEQELGFPVFSRAHSKIKLTAKGRKLLTVTRASLHSIELEVGRLQGSRKRFITIGMTTYFASRWLASRLMGFTSAHPEIGLRIQPTTGFADLDELELDMAIRWGDGKWKDCDYELLFTCPAFPTAGKKLAAAIRKNGLQKQLIELTLLHDHEDSRSWEEWHHQAGLDFDDREQSLVIPDPNVRVEAVINNQGIALNDFLVEDEMAMGGLQRVSDVELSHYGYFLACNKDSINNPDLALFRSWLMDQSLT